MCSTATAQKVWGAELEGMAIAKIESMLDERGDLRRREITLNRNLYDMDVPDGQLEIIPSVSSNINLTS